MGILLLDLTFRVEREFQIKLDQDAMLQFLKLGNTSKPPKGSWTDVQVVDYVRFIETTIAKHRPQPEPDVFGRVKRCIVECLGVDESAVQPQAWMVQDLGME